METLDGRTALVTGAGSGIGRAIAQAIGGAGATVVVCGRRREPLEETIGAITGSTHVYTCDLTNPDDTQRFADEVTEKHGGMDMVVNNAGFSSKVRSARYIGADEWRSVMDVNTLGPAMLTRALLPPMIERGSGHVVMISSMAAINPGVLGGVVYSAAKSAARAYMQVLASEVRQHGVRCTTVFPGEVDTAILDNRALPPDAEARATMMQPEDIADAVLMAVSLPQRAMVSEIAIGATEPRDMTADLAAAMTKRSVE